MFEIVKWLIALAGAGLYTWGLLLFVSRISKQEQKGFFLSVFLIMLGLPLMTIVEQGWLFALLPLLVTKLPEIKICKYKKTPRKESFVF